ncbi:MAG: hypothetical protein ACLFNK_02855 [Candidatus Woesearchaeota archaeon]
MFDQIKSLFDIDSSLTIRRQDYNLYNLSSIKTGDGFGAHIFENRLKIYLHLILIDRFSDEHKFLFGGDDLSFSVNRNEDQNEKTILDRKMGLCVLSYPLDKDSAFSKTLGKFSIRQIISDHFSFDESEILLEDGTYLSAKFKEFEASIVNDEDLDYQAHWYLGETFFVVYDTISADLIVTDKKIFARKDSSIDQFLSKNYERLIYEITDFLNQYSSRTLIPHEVYVDMLIRRFPGKISIRTLS